MYGRKAMFTPEQQVLAISTSYSSSLSGWCQFDEVYEIKSEARPVPRLSRWVRRSHMVFRRERSSSAFRPAWASVSAKGGLRPAGAARDGVGKGVGRLGVGSAAVDHRAPGRKRAGVARHHRGELGAVP